MAELNVDKQFGMMLCTAIVFVFSALQAASKGPGAQGTINALMQVASCLSSGQLTCSAYRFFVGIGMCVSDSGRLHEVS